MTVSLKVHVNGKYKATVVHKAEGRSDSTIEVGPQEEKSIPFVHGVENTLTITEEPVTDEEKSEPEAPAA